MSNLGKFHDPIPGIWTVTFITIGWSHNNNRGRKRIELCATRCAWPTQTCKQTNTQAPGTPEHIKKYRKSFQNQPGLKQVHYGMVGDNQRADNFNYGKATGKSELVGEVMKAQNLSGLADFHNDLKEGQYESHKREPLGKSYVRGHNLPGAVENPEFKFGVATVGSESAKDVLYPFGREQEEKQEVARMYNKTHGAFGPGE